ncbi:MAG: hypothetical protein IJG50_04850 [Clostridia bacterium]|nr:hypothetical protein [Clostridia bacterium]
MRSKRTSVLCIILAAVLVFSFAACSNTNKTADATYENGGVTLSIPSEYDGLLTVETPEYDGSGRLFSVSETASIEAAKALGEDPQGAGWLFTIVRVSEDEMHKMLCADRNNDNFFAKDENGDRYIIALPSDVRLVREEYTDEELESWGELCEWADTVPEKIIEDNEGFTAEAYGSSAPEIALSRAAYMDGESYVVSAAGSEPAYSFDGFDATPYVERLTKNAVYTYSDREEAAGGEYVEIYFPSMDVRFDFFAGDEGVNIVRETWSDIDEDWYYEVTLSDEETNTPYEIITEWYNAMCDAADMSALGYTPDSLLGRWAEKFAGRGVITVLKSEEENMYDVHIEWSSSAAELYVWDMKAAAGSGGVLSYENGRCVLRTYDGDESYTEEVQYENGEGSFVLNSANEIMWQDDTGHAGDDTVFISVD